MWSKSAAYRKGLREEWCTFCRKISLRGRQFCLQVGDFSLQHHALFFAFSRLCKQRHVLLHGLAHLLDEFVQLCLVSHGQRLKLRNAFGRYFALNLREGSNISKERLYMKGHMCKCVFEQVHVLRESNTTGPGK